VAKGITRRRFDLLNRRAEVRKQTCTVARRRSASDFDNSQMRQRLHHASSLANDQRELRLVQFLLLPPMKPWLVFDASRILFRTTELQANAILLRPLAIDGKNLTIVRIARCSRDNSLLG
jgi:hypothetical protein